MDRKEEILKEATKRTINIISGSPLHNAVMEAMETYKREGVIEELESLSKKLRLAGDRSIVNSRISELKK